ncbi:MAG: putative lipid II flippase FtsW [Ruminococcus sp.]|nr:putative lipid II flippase FtsW [Ruminococcus sp.]
MASASNAAGKPQTHKPGDIAGEPDRSKLITIDRPRFRKGPIDIPFVMIILTLLVVGLIMMFSAGYAWAINEDLPGEYYFMRQLGFAVAGLMLCFVASHIDYHIYKKAFIVIGLAAFSLMNLVLCRVGPFANPHNDAYRWIKFPGIPEYQPSEIAKFAIILIFAVIISKNHKKMKRFTWGILPFAAVLAVFAGLVIIEPHISATIIICAIGASMMLVGGTRFGHLLIFGILGGAALIGIVYLMFKMGYTYIGERLTSMLDTMNTGAAETWQTRQSLIAIGSGGWFGLGLGQSRQKFMYLPESKNDFVFAIVCEELGFFGAMIVMLIFVLLIMRGFHIAANAPDKLGMMLAYGLTFQIGIQALLNIAVVTNTIPNTGISLPFFSYGGTALIMQIAQMGIVLNISRQSLIEN